MRETFLVDSEVTRDAIYAGIWNRLCCEIRGHAEGHGLSEYIEEFAESRGDPSTIFGYLDQDIEFLIEARRQLRTLERVPIGSTVELDDIERFMPVAWREDGPTGPGRWIYTDSEAEEAELLAPEPVVRSPAATSKRDAS